MDKNYFSWVNQTLGNHLKLSVGNDVQNLTIYDKIQITDTTLIRHSNQGRLLLKQWIIKCNDENFIRERQKLIKSSKAGTRTPNTGSTNLHPMGGKFL